MFDTGRRDLEANRWVKFVHTLTITGFDFSDADFAMQVRDTRDTTGSSSRRADLSTVATRGDEGIYVVGYADDVTTVEIVIDAATMQAMDTAADAAKPGEDGAAWYDLQITPDGGDAFVALRGAFTIIAGATTA